MSFESRLIQEVNDLRRNPATYADKLLKNKQYFEEGTNIWKNPKTKTRIKTEEGPAAYDEAAEFLNNQAMSRNELDPSKGLNKIALEFLTEFQKDINSKVGIEEVVEKYGKFTGNFRRLVQLGSQTPELAVISLVVGDGDKTRSYRDALLLENLNKIGVAHGEHKDYKHCSVIVICNDFQNTVDSDDTVKL